jgi:hypothetical protein
MKESVKQEIEKLIEEEKLNCSIKKIKDKVSWYSISKYQTLSEDFIKEFKDEVNWTWISDQQNLSEDFKKEFKEKKFFKIIIL